MREKVKNVWGQEIGMNEGVKSGGMSEGGLRMNGEGVRMDWGSGVGLV